MGQIDFQGLGSLLFPFLSPVDFSLEFVYVSQITNELDDLLQFGLGLGYETSFKIGLGEKTSYIYVVGIGI